MIANLNLSASPRLPCSPILSAIPGTLISQSRRLVLRLKCEREPIEHW